MSASRRKGKWIGGHPVLGYDIDPKGGRIIVNPEEAEQVRTLFGLYLELGSWLPVLEEAERRGLLTKRWTTRAACTRVSTSGSSIRTRGIEPMKPSAATTATTAQASGTSSAPCCADYSSA
jgi:DNA invertase Pin-like site-specific DNA recombinase